MFNFLNIIKHIIRFQEVIQQSNFSLNKSEIRCTIVDQVDKEHIVNGKCWHSDDINGNHQDFINIEKYIIFPIKSITEINNKINLKSMKLNNVKGLLHQGHGKFFNFHSEKMVLKNENQKRSKTIKNCADINGTPKH